MSVKSQHLGCEAKALIAFDEGIKAREEKTVEDLFNEYIDRHAKKKRKTWQVMQKDFARTVPMTLRKRKTMQISSTAARDFHSRLTKERGPYAGNRAVQLLRAFESSRLKDNDEALCLQQ